MKSNELTIGDHVSHFDDGKNCVVTELRGRKIAVSYTDDNGNTKYSELLSEMTFEPIPLTAEILEKNGFVANKHVYPYPYYVYTNSKCKLEIGFAFPQGNRTSYKKPWVYIDSEYVFVEHLPCIYVHELQHALRLCGIDKEIEL